MTDLAIVDRAARPHRAAPAVRHRVAGLMGVLLVAAATGLALGRAHAIAPGDFEGALVVLLRFMAACKAASVLGAAALLTWRSGQPIGAAAFAAYGGGLGLMAAAPGMIWNLGLVAPGALLFHAGLLVFAIAAARDDMISFRRRRA